jgi:bifunctional UDP-N-acetylglucosamine pyrophosphorylase/glucosamine-1-phosphate N-acetyltransferase
MKTDQPKVLHTLAGRPLLDYVLDQARELDSQKTIVVAGHKIDAVRAYLKARQAEEHAAHKPSVAGKNPKRPAQKTGNPTQRRRKTQKNWLAQVKIVEQVKQLGTGHAVRKALPSLRGHRGPVVVLYGDVPLLTGYTLKKLLTAFRRRKAAVAFLSMELDEGGAYGRVVRDARGRPVQIVEHSDATAEQREIREVNAGIYCFDLPFLRRAARQLGKTNAQGEFYLTDAIALAHEAGLAVTAYRCPAEETLGVNDRIDLAIAVAALQNRVNAELMMSGVTITHPGSVVIHPSVEVGRDTVIGFGVHLLGNTHIGKGCRIDNGAVLTDTTLADNVWVKPYTVTSEITVGTEAQLGPFSHLRPGTIIGSKAKTGNFVETKKAQLGPGVKANHLSYLGDCEIGQETNVGAGTITCNYDGRDKHYTRIGERVMIGSDTQLVAPVSVADDVTIGAGTTVMHDVPSGALAINPKSQRHIQRADHPAPHSPKQKRKTKKPQRPQKKQTKKKPGK